MAVSYQTIYSTQIYLNSRLADIYLNGTLKSNCAFFFKDVLKIQKNTLEMRLSVVNAEFPQSWYLINETNNNIIINGISYNFPIGNYNVSTFISKWLSFFGFQWTLGYDKLTNIFTWSYASGTFTFSSNSNSLLRVIGFDANKEYTSSGNVLSGVYSFNFYNITRLNIKSSTFNLRNVDSNNRGKTRTIASVPVNSATNGMIYYNNYTHYKSIIKNDHLHNITIEIQDDYKNYVNFNNCDWTITLQVDIVNEVVDDLDTLEDIYNHN